MNKRRILLGALTALVLAALLTVGVFAFFRIVATLDREIGTSSADEAGRVPIASFADLFAYSRSPHYNDDNEVSAPDSRHTLYLTADVKLENNLFINSDVHIDLNGHTLFLNGYTLTVTHAYHGTAVLSNGTVAPYNEAETPLAGRIVFDTPHAVVTLDRLTFVQGESTVEDTFTKVLWQTQSAADEKYALYNALYTLADVLVSPHDNRAARLCYDEVQALERLDLSTVLVTREDCALGNETHACVLACTDLDLPTAYLATNVTFSYASDNAALSNTGNLLTLPDTLTTANLSVTVQCGDTTFTDSVPVHLYNAADPATALQVAQTLFYSRIAGHYDADEQCHVFNRGVHLPTVIEGVVLEYHLFEGIDTPTENFADDIFVQLSAEVLNFEPTSDSSRLRVVLRYGAQTATLDIPMKSGNTGIITTNASLAQNLVESWYGGRLVITPVLKEPDQTVIGYNPVSLFPHTPDLLTKYGIQSVRYELMNNTNDVYEIVGGNTLKVKAGKDPSLYVQSVMLNCIFTFEDPQTHEISVEEIQREIYYDHLGTGNNVNEFLPYYTYFNEMLYAELAGVTTTDFSRPFSYSDTGPFVCYDVRIYNAQTGEYELGIPAFMEINLYYNGAIRHTFAYDGSVSMTELLDAYLASSDLTLSDIVSQGDAAWVFTLDSESIPHTNTAIDLVYHYKMTSDVIAWLRYPNGELEPTTSALYIAGILHQAEDDIPDAELYAWIYNTFNITDDTYSEGKYIVVDWLLQNITIEYKPDSASPDSSFPGSSTLNFKGLEFLTGVKYLNLSNHPALKTPENAGEAARAIAQMTNLETLILTGCAFRDRDNATLPDNDTISRFAALDRVKYLYVDGNDIFGFEWLLEMDALEKVYVHDNLEEDEFSTLVRIFYGSEGLVNLQTFKQLTDVGVAVYNVKSGNNYILFEDSAGINDYIRLSSLEYQKKLATGADISLLYEGFSTEYSDYALSTSYEGVDPGFNHNLSFSFVGDDPTTATAFTLTDKIFVGNQIEEVVIVIVFEIIRV